MAAREQPSLEALPPAPRRRPRAVGLRHRDLPHLPAALQVRARPADPARADASTSASGSSCTRCSSASTAAGSGSNEEMPAPARAGLAPRGLHRLRRGARAAREGARWRCLRYQERLGAGDGEPPLVRALVHLPLGPTTSRGWVDRSTRCRAARYELIDYKTGRPQAAPSSSRDDVQLVPLRARRARGLADSRRPSAPTTTCSTTSSVRLGSADGAARLDRGDRRRRSPAPSWRRPSSRRPPSRSARCASTGSPARRPKSSGVVREAHAPSRGQRTPFGHRHAPFPRAARAPLGTTNPRFRPRWRRKRWNSRAMRSPDGISSDSRRVRRRRAARGARRRPGRRGRDWTARPTWRS